MKLESQVISLELSKKLKELKVKQESLWWWFKYSDGWHLFPIGAKFKKERDCYSAFTVAELGEMLPHFIQNDSGCYHLHLQKIQPPPNASKKYPIWSYAYMDCAKTIDALNNYFAEEDTEANARASLLVYLKEKGGRNGNKI